MTEEWRDIPGYVGRYQISSRGRVKSIARTLWHGYEKGDTIMAQQEWYGYKIVFFRCGGREKRKFRVHRLVAQAFLPNPERKAEVNHKDLDKSNNCVDNLEWATRQENHDHQEAAYARINNASDMPF